MSANFLTAFSKFVQTFLRQEIAGAPCSNSQGEMLEFDSCGPIIQEQNSRTLQRGRWALSTYEEKDHICLIL